MTRPLTFRWVRSGTRSGPANVLMVRDAASVGGWTPAYQVSKHADRKWYGEAFSLNSRTNGHRTMREAKVACENVAKGVLG